MKHPNISMAVVCFIALLLANLIRCTGPSQGVTVYEEPQFKGESRTFNRSADDLGAITGPCNTKYDPITDEEIGDFDNCISSITVDEGWTATLHSRRGYWGNQLRVGSGKSIGYLGDVKGGCGDDWNDCASSITVRRE